MIHNLKTLPEYFIQYLIGNKTFEVRKNDRRFKVGDTVILEEYVPENDTDGTDGYTGRHIKTVITYIFPGGEYGLSKEYSILSLKPSL